jgi:hypothetical protein
LLKHIDSVLVEAVWILDATVPGLEQRARMHAALGEPVRLAIVDHLRFGDASPGELGKEFALPAMAVCDNAYEELPAGDG